MIRLKDISHIYLIGIGGIGMSAIARYLLGEGKQVAGYDRTRTKLTEALEAEGCSITYENSSKHLEGFFNDVSFSNSLVIYTPAIPKGQSTLSYCIEQGLSLVKRAEALSIIARDYKVIAVAGTHGKTTTSAFIAHVLHEGNVPFRAFLGGIAAKYNSNYLSFGAKPKLLVIEADEFDRSFHQLRPQTAVITSIDPDHLDIYSTEESVQEAFQEFAGLVQKDGLLILGPKASQKITKPQIGETITYGLPGADCELSNIRTEQGRFHFSLQHQDATYHLVSGLAGIHNCENATAAYLATKLHVSQSQFAEACASMPGVKRRFEKVYERDGLAYIDDYAHHPEEIKRSIESIRLLYPKRRLCVLFQPHLYSRTKDFLLEFAEVLSAADQVFLLDIYAAREEAIPGISSQAIADNMAAFNGAQVVSREGFLKYAESFDSGVVATLGAGDIDLLVPKIKEALSSAKTLAQ